MAATNAVYLTARETMKRVLQMPETERKTVLDMMRGAIAISDLYNMTADGRGLELLDKEQATRDSA